MENKHPGRSEMKPESVFTAVDYARLVSWPERIRREGPLLKRIFHQAPGKEVLDLGCGPGEHCRFLAKSGFEAVGIDQSESMIAEAGRSVGGSNPRFVPGELQELPSLVTGPFAGAISLGNTLVSLKTEAELGKLFRDLSSLMKPGGVFLFQILNYQRIFEGKIRYLPLKFIREDNGEAIFLRLMELLNDGRLRFCPALLHLDPHADPPLKVLKSQAVEVRGWLLAELKALLKGAAFDPIRVFGDMSGGDFEPSKSNDLVVVARRKGA